MIASRQSGAVAAKRLLKLKGEEKMREWGDWVLVSEPQLMLVNRKQSYEISMSDINSSAQMLDWIFQLHEKSWMSEKSVYDLLTAFRDVLEPQANYCSLGVERNGDGAMLARRYWDDPDPFDLGES